MSEQDEDGIPLLDDIVRTGRSAGAASERGSGGLSEAEIEAIAARVVERHTKEIEAAVARAIRKALEAKQAGSATGGDE